MALQGSEGCCTSVSSGFWGCCHGIRQHKFILFAPTSGFGRLCSLVLTFLRLVTNVFFLDIGMAGSPDEAEQVLLSLEAKILPSGRRLPHVLRQEVTGWHAQEQGTRAN